MTINEAKEKFVAFVRSQLGTREGETITINMLTIRKSQSCMDGFRRISRGVARSLTGAISIALDMISDLVLHMAELLLAEITATAFIASVIDCTNSVTSIIPTKTYLHEITGFH